MASSKYGWFIIWLVHTMAGSYYGWFIIGLVHNMGGGRGSLRGQRPPQDSQGGLGGRSPPYHWKTLGILTGQTLGYLLFPKQSLAVGVLTVLLRGLVLCGAASALPGSIFYCNLQYLVTPTFKTPGKVNTFGEFFRNTLIFTMKY